MRAVCWHDTQDVRLEDVSDPEVLNPRDAVVRITLTTICGSDLHIYDGLVPTMEKGDIIGHEIVGQVVEVGSEVKKIRVGDRVVVVSIIGCGQCWYCKNEQYALCDNSNPNAHLIEKLYNYSTAGIFGYSHLLGGYAGAQAEYIRVPYADTNAFKVPDGMTDEQALMCSDAFPTGYMAADLCGINGAVDTVAVWGCGPVGQFAIKSAALLGAKRVIAIDNIPDRLRMAEQASGAIAINHDDVDVPEALVELTGGRGPDACIDAVGMESHGTHLLTDLYDRAKQKLMLHERADVLRQMIACCRKGGTLSIIGVYLMFADKFPIGVAMNKGLQFRMGQQHGQRYVPRLFEHWRKGEVDPSFVITHRLPLDEAPRAYEMFKNKQDHCVKLALMP